MCSQNIRSLRTVYSAISSEALSSRSGGIEGRPTSLYICSNNGESSLSAVSASSLMRLIGWLAGTRFSGLTKVSIVACGRSCPRILLHLHRAPLYPTTTSCRSCRRGIFQQTAKLLKNPAHYPLLSKSRTAKTGGGADGGSGAVADVDCPRDDGSRRRHARPEY